MIDEHHAGVDAAGHPFAPLYVLGKDGATKAKFRVVGQRNGFVLVLDAKEKRDRPEEFLPEGGIFGFDVG